MRIFNAQLVTPCQIWPKGGVDVAHGRIERVLEQCADGDLDLDGAYLLPGLIDLHVHPAPEDGTDPARLADLCYEVRATGTAGFLFALPNAPVDTLLDYVRALRRSIEAIGPDRGCLGIHFESPYVAYETRGGFSPQAIATPEQFPLEPLLDAGGPWAKYLNISPELPGALEVIRACAARGLPVSLGHTSAERATLLAAIEAGAKTFCHTFDTGAIQRWKEPGVLDVTSHLLAMATDDLVCEVICDGTHVDPILVRLLYRAKGADGVALITDSILGGRAPQEGQEIHTGTQIYRVVNGVGRDQNGCLVGSTLSMARAVKNYMAFAGCGLVQATRAGALTPARVLDLDLEYGRLRPGYRALFCVLDAAFDPVPELCRLANGGA